MEHTASRFRLAVQWHPEAGQDARLFDGFVHACAGPRR
jgi:putative glutamine amidotransferase